jgi:hypothetical protein
MLEFNRLRIDQGADSEVIEYRIEAGRVEGRALRQGVAETAWQRLAPEKLRSHVMAGTMLACWLRRRMGVHELIRACQQDALPPASRDASQPNRTAA